MPDSGSEWLPEIPQYDCGTLGAGHLAGKQSVQDYLKTLGIQTRRVPHQEE